MSDKTLKVSEAAELMGVTEQFIRAALKRDKFPLWGKAVRMKEGGKHYRYIILKEPFMKYIKGDWDVTEVNAEG